MGGYLTKKAILAATTLPTEEVLVPEWADPQTGADRVLVRGLNGREAVEYQQSLYVTRGGVAERDGSNAMAKLVARTVVDAEGERVFTTDDAIALGELAAIALSRVFEAAARLSGLEEEAVEEAGKDSPPTPPASSPSASPATSAAPTRTRSSKRSADGS